MRVLVLSQYYDPEPVEKVHDLARGLLDLGHDVQVLTGFPCYPAGKIYPGYKQRLRFRESVDGVEVTRVPQLPDHSRSSIRRIAYYLFFAISSVAFGRKVRVKPDVIYVYQAALPVGLSGWALSKWWRVPYVVDVVDLWPESVTASGMMKNRLAEILIRAVARFVYRHAAAVNTVTEGFRRNLVANGIDEKKLSVIENWMPESTYRRLSVTSRSQPETPARFTVMYAGNMGAFQHVSTIVEAAALVRQCAHIRFVLIGDGTDYEALVARASELRLDNVTFLGRRRPAEMPDLFATADALLVHLKPDPLTTLSIPSKTFAYLAAGKPLIMAVAGEAASLVEREGFGIAVPPCDPEALATAIVELAGRDSSVLEEMARRATDAYETRYRGGVQIRRMARLIDSVV